MSCDVEFLEEVDRVLRGAHLLAVVLIKFGGSLEFGKDGHTYRVDWGGWLSSTSSPAVGPEAEGYQFASVVGPLIGQQLEAIMHDAGV